MASIKKRQRTKKVTDPRTGETRTVTVDYYRARYRDHTGREHARHFTRKTDAQRWIDEETAALTAGTWTSPKDRRVTVGEWCDRWLGGYARRRDSTVRQARTHIKLIVEEFGSVPLVSVRPSAIRTWIAQLQREGYADSYVYAVHSRLSQVMADAVLDGLVPSNPCSKRTAPRGSEQRPYVATTEQVRGLVDAVAPRYRVAVLLGAFAGLRTAEVCGLRPTDVQWIKREIVPAVQYPAAPLKTAASRTPVPVPDQLVTALSEHVREYPGEWVITTPEGRQCGPHVIQRELRRSRDKVAGLPDGFRFHDLRHYYASALIAHGADVKVVQTRLRHESATTTLQTYTHLWPDRDESTRAVVAAVMSDVLGGPQRAEVTR